MNRNVDFTKLGGLYVYQDTLQFLQTAYGQSLDSLAKSFGDKLIISGLGESGGLVTDGWVIIDGEILPFVGGTPLAKVRVETITTQEMFDDATQKDVYTIKRAVFSNITGFDYSELKRFHFNSTTISGAFNAVGDVLKNIINFEPAVILEGCAVSAIDTMAQTLAIAPGKHLFNGNLVLSAAYTGSYPAYLTAANTWVTVEPSSGDYIEFNPQTSQRYKDVLRRFNYQTGDLYFSKVLSDRFDLATGLGRWEWKGWKLSDDMAGRVGVGFDRRSSDPQPGVAENIKVWDAAYNTIGNTGGEKKHILTKTELPAVNILGNANQSSVPSGGLGLLRKTLPGENKTISTSPDSTGSGNEFDVTGVFPLPNMGDGVAHENRQPFRVIAVLERI